MAKPFLWDVVNTLYHSVMDNMPQAIQDRSVASAFILGTAGSYGLVRGLQWTSKNLIKKIIPDFDKKILPKLEKVCIVGLASVPLVYSLIDPEGANQILSQHPVYSAGMIGVYTGSITGAVQDLHKKSKQNLEESLTTPLDIKYPKV